MIESHDYPVLVEWTEGKAGLANSPDGLPGLKVASPPEFGGPPKTWSPEHLFVAAVASCFMTTFQAIAELSKLDFVALDVPAVGSLVRGEDRRYRITQVALTPTVVLTEERSLERARRIVEKSEKACLITNSISATVTVEPTFSVAPSGES